MHRSKFQVQELNYLFKVGMEQYDVGKNVFHLEMLMVFKVLMYLFSHSTISKLLFLNKIILLHS